MAPPRGKEQVKLNAVMFSLMVGEMLSGPCTAQHLADCTGMHVLTVQRTLRSMHRNEVAHITGYEKDVSGRSVIRVFGFGPGKDAKRPPPKSRAQRSKEQRVKDRRAPLMAQGNPFAGLMA